MKVENKVPIKYYLELERDFIFLNSLIGKEIELKFLYFECLNCQKEEIYRSGYCKKCFFVLPQTGLNITKPHLSKAHLGIKQRNLEWEKTFELQNHIVYLADNGAPKVGVTRENQISTRWIDQGALRALRLAKTANRYLAGMIELALSEFISDKTNYRKMLSQTKSNTDLIKIKYELKEKIPSEFQTYFLDKENDVFEFFYPIAPKGVYNLNLSPPRRVHNLDLKKTKWFKKKLSAIKGQYLLFEDGNVFNVRKHAGFCINLSI